MLTAKANHFVQSPNFGKSDKGYFKHVVGKSVYEQIGQILAKQSLCFKQ